MELQNKFKHKILNPKGNFNDTITKCVTIADEHAIKFAEWCVKWRVEFVDDTQEGILYTYGGMYQKYSMSELLEIFKNQPTN